MGLFRPRSFNGVGEGAGEGAVEGVLDEIVDDTPAAQSGGRATPKNGTFILSQMRLSSSCEVSCILS
jgi:hypothetical protein